MKYISEYRNSKLFSHLLSKIESVVTKDWILMEICGGQTHSLVKNGILNMLPEKITMVHGPGCPVCVTPLSMIDKAVGLSLRNKVILCSFGDMVKVPGSYKSLLQARAEGANVKIVYSPLDALKIAEEYPDHEVVFFGVGFETTAPANALAILLAEKKKLHNFSVLVSHVLVPPAMISILDDTFSRINAFLAAGHVCSVMGLKEYFPITNQYKVPIVVTGFEPVDLLEGILMTVKQLEKGMHNVENQYKRVVRYHGNIEAQSLLKKVFEIADREWRGIGIVPKSGYRIRKEFGNFDAESKFNESIQFPFLEKRNLCVAGEILRGIKKPLQCPHFKKECTPLNPLGAPMVSTEGACAAYYHFNQ